MSTKETREIDAWNLVDLLQEVAQNTKDGFELDVETNEGYPKQFGTRFVLQMHKDITEKAEAPAKRGPKPKVSDSETIPKTAETD